MTIYTSSSLQVSGTTFSFPKIGGERVAIEQTNPGGGVPGYLQLAADTPEAIPIAEITAPGVGHIKNLDDTNTVQFGKMVAAAFEEFQDIRPGEEYLFRISTGVVPYLNAVGGAANVQIYIFED